MSDDGRILGDVAGNPLVGVGLVGSLVRRHADGVTDYLREDFIILDCGQLKLLQTEVFLAIEAYCFCFHGILRLYLFVRYASMT